MTTTTAIRPISTKQIELIKRLCDERDICVTKLVTSRFGRGRNLYNLTGGRTGEASELIGFLFETGRGVEGTTPARISPEAGLYQLEDMVVRIRVARSGQWYAQQVMRTPLGFKWEYLGKRIDMRGAQRLDDEVAAEFLEEVGLQ
jgi:hypothetical protein